MKIRWSLYWPQGRGKTTCYQQLRLAFHFLVFKLIIPLLPVMCAPWRQCEQSIKQASSTSLPVSTTPYYPYYLPSPPGPQPTAHQKQNNSKLSPMLYWKYCFKTCGKKSNRSTLEKINAEHRNCFSHCSSNISQEFLFRQI